MTLLRIIAKGIPLFSDTLDISFLAEQRVDDLDRRSLIELKPSSLCINPVNAFAGINASGKTTTIKLLSLVYSYAFRGLQLSAIEEASILGKQSEADISLFFLDDEGKVSLLESTIVSEPHNGYVDRRFAKEKLFVKTLASNESKKGLFDENTFEEEDSREGGENQKYLAKDMSIALAWIKKTSLLTSFLDSESFRIYSWPTMDVLPTLKFLDHSIEDLHFEEVGPRCIAHLKFKGREEIVLEEPESISRYLSSGTMKGLSVFSSAIETLTKGGMLFIDEIENHFNKQIVVSLVNLFFDKRINVGKGQLVFSTHYPELLDIFDRNDCIHILRNEGGISAMRLSSRLSRNDIKKSDLYESDLLGGTSPSHNSYIALKSFIEHLGEGK